MTTDHNKLTTIPPEARGLRVEPLKAFKVVLSSKDEVKCDADEIKALVEGISTGNIIKLRRGLVNPSFLVAVLEDEDRRVSFQREIDDVIRHNEHAREYGRGEIMLKNLPQPDFLKDIFEGVQLKDGTVNVPQLSTGKQLKDTHGTG